MYSFKDIIDDIEQNLDKKIDVSELASKAGMSVYEFRRIFSFATGISFAEYVRKRRLSNAAIELYESGKTVTELASKYGYDSPSSFSRAFKEFHGFSPSNATDGKRDFKLFTKISTEIITSGGKDISYSVFHEKAFRICGFCGRSDLTDTECCENVWDGFYKSDFPEKLCGHDKLYAVYINENNSVKCVIGSDALNGTNGIDIAESDWVSFKLNTTDEKTVNEFYKDVLNQWFSSSGYSKRDGFPNVEVFPSDMSKDGFEWEIRIAVKK